ncbi:MAG TPA: type III-B CRISPR module RAMP protein Cmr1 [Nannocystaceae bacterium]|nr:type III-B CRISPR module RAMP protein Cmr1 [Nannocystaceae bacterium]
MSKVNVREVIATYRVVTPLFSAGANPTGAAELRVPSLKGVLRFWWRALAWSELGGELPKIQKEEDALFGCGGEGARRSRVVMYLKEVSDGVQVTSGALQDLAGDTVGHGVRYLGYGLMGAFGANAGKIMRACRGGPLEFKLHLRCRDVDDVDRLLRALRALGTVGGLGARSRRGFGSLVLTSLEGDVSPWRAPATLEDLRQELRHLTKGSIQNGEPAYTAFSRGGRHVLVMGDANVTDPLVLLDRVGREMVRYRSYGKHGRIFEKTEEQAEANFRDDHDLVLAAEGRRPVGHPRRVAFGLPHNYYFSGTRKKSVNVGPAGGRDRRASPLFIHLHMVGPQPVAVLTFLPAIFLPGRSPEVKIGGRSAPLAPADQLYQPIHAFLDRMMGKGRREPFGEALEVRYDAR